jgi:hypothetical protein
MLTFSRRRLLQSLGLGAGATLFSPLIRQVWANDPPPRRFVLVVEGNGIYPYSFLSPKARAAVESQMKGKTIGASRILHTLYGHTEPLLVEQDDTLAEAPCLGPLADQNGQVSLLDQAAVVLGLSSTVTGGGHSSQNGALSCARGGTVPLGPSIDAVLAAKLKGKMPFDALRVGITAINGNPLIYQTCAEGPGLGLPVITSPVTAFESVFGSISDVAAFARQGELLAFGQGQTQQALKTFGGSSRERQKLESYLQALEQLQTRQKMLLGMQDVLKKVQPVNPATQTSTEPMDWLAWQFDLATASLLGGLTQVVVIASATAGGFDIAYPDAFFDKVTDPKLKSASRHEIHHQMAYVKGYPEVVAAATRYHVEQIARMARALQQTPEGNGTALDHTAIVYLPDNGEQHHSTGREWPMLLVGGKAMGLKADGRSVVYPGHGKSAKNERMVSNLFNTLGHMAGIDLDTFGLEQPSQRVEGPLGAELWAPV